MHTDGLQLPGPLALTLRDLDTAIQGKDIGMVAIRLKDVTDTLVHIPCAYALAVCRCSPKREQERDYELLRFLPRPSTGQLINLFGVLLKEVRAGPEPCATMYRLFVETDGGKRYRSLRTLAEYRNSLFHKVQPRGAGLARLESEPEDAIDRVASCVDVWTRRFDCTLCFARSRIPVRRSGAASTVRRLMPADSRLTKSVALVSSTETIGLFRSSLGSSSAPAQCRIRRLFLYESCRSTAPIPRGKAQLSRIRRPSRSSVHGRGRDSRATLRRRGRAAVILSVGPWARAVFGQLRDSSAVGMFDQRSWARLAAAPPRGIHRRANQGRSPPDRRAGDRQDGVFSRISPARSPIGSAISSGTTRAGIILMIA